MAETIRYGLIGKQDVKTEPRTGTFEVTLPDGSRVTLDALDVGYFIADAVAKASLPASSIPSGIVYRVTDNERGLWMFQGSQFFGLSHEWINIREFGATGDGGTNDRAAVQAALDAVPDKGATVYFPPGTYIISETTLDPKANTRLLGAGNRVSTIKANPGEQNLTLVTVDQTNVTFESLGFTGGGKVSDTTGTNYRNGNGVFFNGVTNGVVRSCYFTRCHNSILDEDSTRKILVLGNEFLVDHRAQACVQFRGTAESAIMDNFFDQSVSAASGVEKGAIWTVNGVNTLTGIVIYAGFVSDNMSPTATYDSKAGIRKIV